MIDHPVDRARDRCPECGGKNMRDCNTCGGVDGDRASAMILLIGTAAWFGCVLIMAWQFYKLAQ